MVKKIKCIYCSQAVEKIDYEGVCKECHKVNDENDEGNGDVTCIYCGNRINEDDSNYVDGEGSACYDCSTYCESCGTAHNNDDVDYCNGCEESSCGDHYKCSKCGETFCEDCITTCSGCSDNYCSECLKACSNCGESFCKDCLTNELCDDCLEKSKEVKEDGKTK